MNTGWEIFKRMQRLQGGSEAVPSELPSPPYEGENYAGKAIKWLGNEVRQGILPDEALDEIKRDPTSARALAAYAGAALSAGTLLSGGRGGGEKLPIGGGEKVPIEMRAAELPKEIPNRIPTKATDLTEEQFASLADEFQAARKEANKIRSWPAYEIRLKEQIGEDGVREKLQRFSDLRNDFERIGNFKTQKYQSQAAGGYLDSQQLTERTVDGNWARKFYRKQVPEQELKGGTSVVRGYPPTHAFNNC